MLAEVFLIRGLVFTHEAVRDWGGAGAAAGRGPAQAAGRQGRPVLARR